MNEKQFIEALNDLNIKINDLQLKQFDLYFQLLIEWNEKINLTGITKKEDVYLKHFYDSATLVKIINFNDYETFCDVGTGAGFPGIVIKILYPNLNVTLIDSLNKRLIFLDKVIETLNLTKIKTIHSRIEDYSLKNSNSHDIVSARAVSQLNVLLELCMPIVKVGGYFIPMKGNISQEIIEIDGALRKLSSNLETKLEFVLPYENSQRTLLKFKKTGIISNKYPRSMKMIKQNPL